MELPVFESSCTVQGELAPWEIAKVFALHTVIKTFSEQLDEPASKLLGKPLAEYIAEHVTCQGGGYPEPWSWGDRGADMGCRQGGRVGGARGPIGGAEGPRGRYSGGGHPEPRQVHRVVARCSQADWYPGKRTEARKGAGRPQTFSEHQKNEVARVAMELKRKRLAPTPRRVRARLPGLTINKETEQRMSNSTIQRVYATRCYDETPDDPWQFRRAHPKTY